MQQLLYISTARHDPDRPITAADILAVSRTNNARDGVTGLLLYDGVRFLQVLEGEDRVVAAAFERIRRDPRHRAVVVLSQRETTAREFGDWSMAYQRRDEDAADTIRRVVELSANASPTVQATFRGLAEMRRAA